MAAYSTEEVDLHIRRWIVPAAGPWGATAAEVSKAWVAADRAYRQHHGIRDNEAALPDNALRFRVGDGEIIIEFSYETRNESSDD